MCGSDDDNNDNVNMMQAKEGRRADGHGKTYQRKKKK